MKMKLLALMTAAFALQGEHEGTIPTIDFKAIKKAKGEERSVLIQDFGNKILENGFVSFPVSDKTQKLIDKATEVAAAYFEAPLEEKMEDFHDNNCQTGYCPYSYESASGEEIYDLKETYFIPPKFKSWPDGKPEFKKVMKKYHKEMSKHSKMILEYLAEFLGQGKKEFKGAEKAESNLLRLAHYFKPEKDDPQGAVWAKAHKDLNAITLLPKPTEPGLEILTKEGSWLPVFVPEGHMILNLGEQLEMKTAGYLTATPHQVVNPHIDRDRIATIFFGSLKSDYSLKPFDVCVEKQTEAMSEEEREAFLKNYPDVTVQEALTSRIIEIEMFKNPERELVEELRGKGLLQNPPAYLVDLYPDLF